MSTSRPFSITEPLWLRDYARYRQQRWDIPMVNTFAQYQTAAHHERLEMHRLWHEIEKHRVAQPGTNNMPRFLREIGWEIRMARKHGDVVQVYNLEALKRVLGAGLQ